MLALTVKTSGNLKAKLVKLWRDYRELSKGYVAVGWDAHAGRYPGGQSVAQVALWNEFGSHNADGSVRSPARPFMRPAYQENRPAIDALRTQVVQKITDGKMTPQKALDTLGYRMQLYIQAKIKSNPGPPLAARTLARKRASGRPAVTLIDTRRMLDTLTYRIYTGYFGGGEQTGTAKALQQTNAFSSAKLNAKAAERVQKMRSARQIKAEKQRLRDELKAAKAQKRRSDMRAAKKVRAAAKRQKKKDAATVRRYKKAEARKTKYEKKIRAKNEKHARKSEQKAIKRNRQQIKGTFAKAAKKARTMAARDKRQAKGLSRIRKLTPAQKEAKAAREKLQRGNQLRLRAEKNAERKEITAERNLRKKARQQTKAAKKKITKQLRRDTKAAKVAAQKAKKAHKKAVQKVYKQRIAEIRKGLPQ